MPVAHSPNSPNYVALKARWEIVGGKAVGDDVWAVFVAAREKIRGYLEICHFNSGTKVEDYYHLRETCEVVRHEPTTILERGLCYTFKDEDDALRVTDYLLALPKPNPHLMEIV